GALVLLVCTVRVDARECDDSDIVPLFSFCEFDERLIYFILEPDCTNAEEIVIPDPVMVPCDLRCGAGTKYDLTAEECVTCEEGTFAIGGGAIYTTFDDMPAEMTTTCTGEGCTLWTPMGGYLQAGAGSTSTLETEVFIFEKDSSVTFEFVAKGEPLFDSLSLIVDGETVLYEETCSYSGWRLGEASLDPGLHSIQWVYSKDTEAATADEFVAIRLIEMSGSSVFDLKCTECPTGHYTPDGAHCINNPDNTWSTAGSAAPTDCGENEYSLTGASHCKDMEACVEGDYTLSYGECDMTTLLRPVIHVLREPVICSATLPGAYVPGEAYTVPCTGCEPGSEHVGGGVCTACAAGLISDGTVECSPCQPGYVPATTLSYTSFPTFPEGGSTNTTDPLGSEWVIGDDTLRSGYLQSSGLYNWFSLPLSTSVSLASLTLSIDMPATAGLNVFAYVDGVQMLHATAHSNKMGEVTETTSVYDAGAHLLEIGVIMLGDITNPDDTLVSVVSIVLDNAERILDSGTDTTPDGMRTAGECVPCPAGTAPSELTHTCQSCPKGYYAAAEDTECKTCPEDSIAPYQ
ncbi:hypothetical protein KIPB_005406, partial [Kipferlia bialata]